MLFGVVSEARLRFLMENHAHDIYDAFQAIHARVVSKSTYFFMDELHNLIRAAHSGSQAKHEEVVAKPLMGHDVQVTNLWKIRDIWAWLAPGWEQGKQARETAKSNASFVYYGGLSGYRDVLLKKEEGSDQKNPRVGLWAKVWMTDKEYSYMGTVTTWELFRNTVGHASKPAVLGGSRKRGPRDDALLKKLDAASKGIYKEQLSPERLADAKAICRRDWNQFRDCIGELPADGHLQRLPHELAVRVHKARKQRAGVVSAVSVGAVGSGPVDPIQAKMRAAFPELAYGQRPQALVQRVHKLADIHNIIRGANVQLNTTHRGLKFPSVQDFIDNPIQSGTCVVTHIAKSSPLGRAYPEFAALPFWVWRVLRIFKKGDVPPETEGVGDKKAKHTTYEAQLLRPSALRMTEPFEPLWDTINDPVYLLSPAERLARGLSATSSTHHDASDALETRSHTIRLPLCAYLRRENIVGGGFHMTVSKRLPKIVREHAELALFRH